MAPAPYMISSNAEESLAPAAIAAVRRDELARGYLVEEEVRSLLAIDHETLVRWRKARKILAVWYAPGKRYLYPPYQLVGGHLLPEIATLLATRETAGPDRSGWSTVEWLLSPHVLLKNQRPAEILQSAPDRVIAALRAEFAG